MKMSDTWNMQKGKGKTMNTDRIKAIHEELQEVQTMAELKSIYCFGQSEAEGGDYADAEFTAPFKAAVAKMRLVPKEPEMTLADKVASMLRDLPKPPVQRGPRASNKYRLLSTDVSWSTKPQVGTLMRILGANAKVGDVLDEEHIVEMMVQNESVLKTKQGGKKIWNYYKGMHFEGLEMHRNVEKVS